MGIRYLNRFLKENAAESIKLCRLAELYGKKIAVDISIYMYRFASDDNLIENIYLMLSVFRYYNIIPIFVFDGKPPPEKSDLLQKRKEDKQKAEEEYNKLKNTLEINHAMDDADKQEIIYNMDMLKKKFVSINKNDIETVKNLIRYYGATYYDAPGEADELCAMLTIKEKVWACLSEDMDMFVYGCPRVIRYLSLLNHTAVIYDVKGILNNLGVSQKELREICVLSGTDYNLECDDTNIKLTSTLKYFKKYHKSKSKLCFYDWLNENNENIIKDYELLKKIYDMFDLSQNHYNIKLFEKVKIVNGPIMKTEIYNILKADGFLFP
jgi:flap endonuclease-1